MPALRCFLLLTLLLGGCSDPGTATGPADAPELGAAESSAITQAPAAGEAAPLSSPSAAPGGAAGDDDSAASGPAGDDDSAASGPAGDDDSSAPGPAANGDSASAAASQPVAAAEAVAAGATEGKELICDDREDNDGDRAVDCDDTDCWAVPACEAPEPGDWADQGPGPGLGVDGEKAPGPEGADGGPRRPEDDGVGVACADYIGCVCGLSEVEAGRTIGGYSHTTACKESGSLVGNPAEEYCGEELDKLKEVLAGAAQAYVDAEITVPASCN